MTSPRWAAAEDGAVRRRAAGNAGLARALGRTVRAVRARRRALAAGPPPSSYAYLLAMEALAAGGAPRPPAQAPARSRPGT